MVTADRVRVSWCWRCRAWGPGRHGWSDSAFDQWSVEVTQEEVDYALAHSGPVGSKRNRLAVRWNLAFGKHLGVYERPY